MSDSWARPRKFAMKTNMMKKSNRRRGDDTSIAYQFEEPMKKESKPRLIVADDMKILEEMKKRLERSPLVEDADMESEVESNRDAAVGELEKLKTSVKDVTKGMNANDPVKGALDSITDAVFGQLEASAVANAAGNVTLERLQAVPSLGSEVLRLGGHVRNIAYTLLHRGVVSSGQGAWADFSENGHISLGNGPPVDARGLLLGLAALYTAKLYPEIDYAKDASPDVETYLSSIFKRSSPLEIHDDMVAIDYDLTVEVSFADPTYTVKITATPRTKYVAGMTHIWAPSEDLSSYAENIVADLATFFTGTGTKETFRGYPGAGLFPIAAVFPSAVVGQAFPAIAPWTSDKISATGTGASKALAHAAALTALYTAAPYLPGGSYDQLRIVRSRHARVGHDLTGLGITGVASALSTIEHWAGRILPLASTTVDRFIGGKSSALLFGSKG